MKNLILGALKTGVGVYLNLIFRMASTKIMAVMRGPSGVGLYSLILKSSSHFWNNRHVEVGVEVGGNGFFGEGDFF